VVERHSVVVAKTRSNCDDSQQPEHDDGLVGSFGLPPPACLQPGSEVDLNRQVKSQTQDADAEP
jgi:hypothetical protein